MAPSSDPETEAEAETQSADLAPAAGAVEALVPAADRAARRWLLALMALYVVAAFTLVAMGRFAFFPKEVLIPVLLLPAALSGQLRRFVRDWAVFIALIVLFDSLRGLIFSATTFLERPVYMTYAIEWERALLGGEILPVILQRAFFDGTIGAFEKLLVVVHASHFVAFFLFGLIVWYWRRGDFQRYSLAVLFVCYGGLVVYFLAPTVPPWMAQSYFGVLPPFARTVMTTYNTYIPAVASGFDTNPIAAMPSLHCAIPSVMSIFGLLLFGWRSAPMLVYTALVYLSVTYSGEHYLVDVLAGIALAMASAALAYGIDRLRATRRAAAAPGPDASPDVAGHATEQPNVAFGLGPLGQQLVLAGLIGVMVVFVVQSSRDVALGWAPSEEFARRELLGKSPVAHYILGRGAFMRRDFATAASHLERMPRQQGLNETVRLLAMSYFETGRDAAALRLLDYPTGDEAERMTQLYWRTVILSHYGRLATGDVERAVATLEQSEHGGAKLAAMLKQRGSGASATTGLPD